MCRRFLETSTGSGRTRTGPEWDLAAKRAEGWMASLGKKVIPRGDGKRKMGEPPVRPLLDEYVENMKKQGLPGKEALGFCLAEAEEDRQVGAHDRGGR